MATGVATMVMITAKGKGEAGRGVRMRMRKYRSLRVVAGRRKKADPADAGVNLCAKASWIQFVGLWDIWRLQSRRAADACLLNQRALVLRGTYHIQVY